MNGHQIPDLYAETISEGLSISIFVRSQSESVVEASWLALVDATEYKLFEDREAATKAAREEART